MSIEQGAPLCAEDWQAYADVYGFVGNELLLPINRSGNLVGLDPAFWASAPVPPNEVGKRGLKRLIAYAEQSVARDSCRRGSEGSGDDARVPGMLAASVEYAHLFIGPPCPAASPWETTNDPSNPERVGYGRATVEVKRLLAEEGFELGGQANQYEDHIGVELLYLSLLANKAAHALADGDFAAAHLFAEKSDAFLLLHPLAWISSLRASVDAERPAGYYSALLEYVHGVLEDQHRSLMAQLSQPN